MTTRAVNFFMRSGQRIVGETTVHCRRTPAVNRMTDSAIVWELPGGMIRFRDVQEIALMASVALTRCAGKLPGLMTAGAFYYSAMTTS